MRCPSPWLFLLLTLVALPAYGQIPVSLPDTQATAQTQTIRLPVTTGDLTGKKVVAYDVSIEYDPSVLRINGFDKSSTLSSAMSLVSNTSTSGVFHLSASTSGGALEGTGVLFYITADLVASGETALTWTRFNYNEGDPAANPINGRLVVVRSTPTEADRLPTTYALHVNAPNPFTERTTLTYTLPDAAHARLDVYDMLGRHVATLADSMHPAGTHTRTFEAGHLPVGLYLSRLTTPQGTYTRTLTLVR